jgi:Asp-tRNA(Asn)/Glu-tRNA(Gln) amidotransferase A subunit family amidase
MNSPFPDYESYDALGLAELVHRGDVSAEELLEAALLRVEQRNPALNALVLPMEKQAREAIAAGLPEGPLRGVPYLLKDLHLLYSGVRTTSGSRLFKDRVADHDSELVARYKRAGLVIFGKTASPEFGLSTSTESTLFGRTANPWNPEHSSGGSSGGASAAVASGMVPAANASDGGGSIRIPASCCGLFGLKPTRARTPSGPDAGEGWSGMSCMHAVTRTVRDSAALLDASHGADVGAPYWAPPPERPFRDEVGAAPGRLRIAMHPQPFNAAPVHADCLEALDDAARLLERLGHDIEEAQLPIDVEEMGRATGTIISAQLRALVTDRTAELGRELEADDLETITRVMFESVAGRSAEDYARAIKVIHGLGRQVEGLLQDFDLILSPTMATPPLPLGLLSLSNPDLADYGRRLVGTVGYTQLFNASGHPAMSVPLFWNAAGLPIGIQLAARFGDEATLLRVAAQLEAERPWFDRRAPGLDSLQASAGTGGPLR